MNVMKLRGIIGVKKGGKEKGKDIVREGFKRKGVWFLWVMTYCGWFKVGDNE